MLRLILAVAVFIIALSSAGTGLDKQRRVALVIGNSSYQKAAELGNPRNDAKGMAEALVGLDFEVIEGLDVGKPDFDRKVVEFARKLKRAEVGLFYYAGHGVQVNGRNYLVPVDAELEDEVALRFAMVELNTVLQEMEREERVNIVFLDACRDNPLATNLARSMGTRGGSISRGLAETQASAGTLIAFATAPGHVAKDGDADHSPFTAALLEHIKTPGLHVQIMMQRVIGSVREATRNEQVPWMHTSMERDFMFMPKVEEPPAPPAVMPGGGAGDITAGPVITDYERLYWQSIIDKEDAAMFRAYLTDYPHGRFARIAELLARRYEPKPAEPESEPSNRSEKKPPVDRAFFSQCFSKDIVKRKLSMDQVDSINAFLDDWDVRTSATDLRWLAYIIVTAWHNSRLSPLREGAGSHEKAVKAARWAFEKGLVKHPYHLPDPVTGKVYYGRGFAMLTWAANYKQIGQALGYGDKLYLDPDLLLQPKIAATVLASAMIGGTMATETKPEYTDGGASRPANLQLYFNDQREDWKRARTIVKGDFGDIAKTAEPLAELGRKTFACLRLTDKTTQP